jgi:hypothetical protein
MIVCVLLISWRGVRQNQHTLEDVCCLAGAEETFFGPGINGHVPGKET